MNYKVKIAYSDGTFLNMTAKCKDYFIKDGVIVLKFEDEVKIVSSQNIFEISLELDLDGDEEVSC